MTPLEILNRYKKLCVVGLSPDSNRTSHSVSAAMQAQGFEIVGVNPSVSETILGCPVYARLADVPGPLEVINVFRNSSVVASLIDELLPLRPKVIWLQEGVFDPSAENRARAAGIQVVSDTCIWKIWASRPRQ